MLVPGSQREGAPGPGRLPPYPLPSLRRQDPRPSPELERNPRLFQLRGLPPASTCALWSAVGAICNSPRKATRRIPAALLTSTHSGEDVPSCPRRPARAAGGKGAAPAPGLGPLPPSSPQLPPAARAARSWQGPASQTPARCPPGPGTRSSPRAPGLGGESGAAPTPSPRPAAPVQHRDGGQRPDGGAAEPGSREEGES